MLHKKFLNKGQKIIFFSNKTNIDFERLSQTTVSYSCDCSHCISITYSNARIL